LACSALTSHLAVLVDPSVAENLINKFFQTLRKRDKNAKSSAQDTIGHGAGLGLLALVQSVPYSVPTWLPSLLADMVHYESDSNILVRQAVKNAFASFWRTHLDMWPLFEQHFTQEQLSTIRQFGHSSSSYYL